jgi:hypothetical protein
MNTPTVSFTENANGAQESLSGQLISDDVVSQLASPERMESLLHLTLEKIIIFCYNSLNQRKVTLGI